MLIRRCLFISYILYKIEQKILTKTRIKRKNFVAGKIEDFHAVDNINHVGNWFTHHQQTMLLHIVNTLLSVVIIIIGWFAGQIFSNGIKKILFVRRIDNTIISFISTLIKYIIVLFAFIAALGRMGVQTNSIIAVLGAAGMAIGLALQNSLSNFSAGVLLVTLQPFRTGEYVNFGSVAGYILEVHVFHTTLKTLDGKIIIVPNGKIIAGNIVNYSREPIRRNMFIISVSHAADVDLVIKTLQSVVDQDKRVLKEPKPVIGLSEFAPSSLNFTVKCWSNTKELKTVYNDLILKFKKSLDQNNISIPFPKMDIYLHKNNKQSHEN